jgi:hypothetical protein
MTANNINPSSPETAKFLAWYDSAKKRGLMDTKFYPRNVDGATVESFLAEVNTARNAETVNRPDFS